MAAQIFAILVAIVIAGWLWFYIVRPILEDFGVIRPAESVNNSQVADYNMSSDDDRADEKRQHPYQAPEPRPNQRVPDTYQANRGTAARTSAKMSDAEWIAVLASAKDENGKERFTANAIAALVGGTRKDVLDQVRAIRNMPKFPELTPEQQAFRERLGLPQR